MNKGKIVEHHIRLNLDREKDLYIYRALAEARESKAYKEYCNGSMNEYLKSIVYMVLSEDRYYKMESDFKRDMNKMYDIAREAIRDGMKEIGENLMGTILEKEIREKAGEE